MQVRAPAQASVSSPPTPSCCRLPPQAGAGSFQGDTGSPGCRQPSRQQEERRPSNRPGSERQGLTLIYDIKISAPTQRRRSRDTAVAAAPTPATDRWVAGLRGSKLKVGPEEGGREPHLDCPGGTVLGPPGRREGSCLQPLPPPPPLRLRPVR